MASDKGYLEACLGLLEARALATQRPRGSEAQRPRVFKDQPRPFKNSGIFKPAETSPGLLEASPSLIEASLGLSEASQGFSEAIPGLSKASPGLSKASPGLSKASPGLSKESPVLVKASQRLAEAPERPQLASEKPDPASGRPQPASDKLRGGRGGRTDICIDGQTDVQIPPKRTMLDQYFLS